MALSGRSALVRGALLTLPVLAVLWLALRYDGPAEPERLGGLTMGTTYSVVIDATLSAGERGRIRDTVERTLARVEALMSTYDPESELSRFNESESTEPVEVTRDLLEVVRVARDVHERSGGAFDPTVGPLVDVWGFGPVDIERPPDAALVEQLRSRVGLELIEIDASGSSLAKGHPDLALDLSGIAKGYAVDRVAAELASLGYGRFLVEVGGEIRAGGARRDGRAWNVGVEAPAAGDATLVATMEIGDLAVATSGDYRNFYRFDDETYAHILDPRTGAPRPFIGFAVTVVGPTVADADAWATALTVLGPDEGFRVASAEEVGALFVVPDGRGGFRSRPTQRFSALVAGYAEAPRR